ncbi:MAG: putative phosphoprotein [Wenzhou bat rhabdovirus 2]|nr:MAG: putative phosphoprotein [Wenzhou bat rhabdovirus 2]
MDDKHVYDRIAQLAKSHPALDTVSTDVLHIDQDGNLQSSPTHSMHHQTDFVPDLDTPQQLSQQSHELPGLSSPQPLNELLSLVIPSQLPDRELLIRKLSDSVMAHEYQLLAEAVRDLIFAARTGTSDRGRARDRSAHRVIQKPPFNDLKAKLSGLITKNKQPMFSDKWIVMIYERCEAATIEKLLTVQNLGNLALTLKGSHPSRFNERVLYHLNLLGV